MKKIALASDHAGFAYKQELLNFLTNKGFECADLGTDSEQSVDYPDYVHPLAESIEQQKYEAGVLICGSGNGVAITANKHQGIRAALCWTSPIAQLARQHNNANVICIPARFVSLDEATQMLETFLNTDFEGGRHANRVQKIACM